MKGTRAAGGERAYSARVVAIILFVAIPVAFVVVSNSSSTSKSATEFAATGAATAAPPQPPGRSFTSPRPDAAPQQPLPTAVNNPIAATPAQMTPEPSTPVPTTAMPDYAIIEDGAFKWGMSTCARSASFSDPQSRASVFYACQNTKPAPSYCNWLHEMFDEPNACALSVAGEWDKAFPTLKEFAEMSAKVSQPCLIAGLAPDFFAVDNHGTASMKAPQGTPASPNLPPTSCPDFRTLNTKDTVAALIKAAAGKPLMLVGGAVARQFFHLIIQYVRGQAKSHIIGVEFKSDAKYVVTKDGDFVTFEMESELPTYELLVVYKYANVDMESDPVFWEKLTNSTPTSAVIFPVGLPTGARSFIDLSTTFLEKTPSLKFVSLVTSIVLPRWSASSQEYQDTAARNGKIWDWYATHWKHVKQKAQGHPYVSVIDLAGIFSIQASQRQSEVLEDHVIGCEFVRTDPGDSLDTGGLRFPRASTRCDAIEYRVALHTLIFQILGVQQNQQ